MNPKSLRQAYVEIQEYVRSSENTMLLQRPLLGLLAENDRISYKAPGYMLEWGSGKRLPWRGYRKDMKVTETELVGAIGPDPPEKDFIEYWMSRVKDVFEDVVQSVPCYLDGNKSTKDFHGVESVCNGGQYAGTTLKRPWSPVLIDYDDNAIRKGILERPETDLILVSKSSEKQFPNSIDGVNVAADHGIADDVAYGLNSRKVRFHSIQSTIFVAGGPMWDKAAESYRLWIDSYGNFQFDPAHVVKWQV